MAHRYAGETKRAVTLVSLVVSPFKAAFAILGAAIKAPFQLIGWTLSGAWNGVTKPVKTFGEAWDGIKSIPSKIKSIPSEMYQAPGKAWNGVQRVSTVAIPDVEGAAGEVERLHEKIKGNPDLKAGLKPHLDGAVRNLDQTIDSEGLHKKKLGGSAQSAWHAIQEKVFGIDRAHIGSKNAGNVADKMSYIRKTGNAGFFERVASKPFRVVAHHPRVAALLAGAAALMGVSGLLSGNEARRTADNLDAEMMQAQQMALGGNPYMNSVSPQEVALLNARMRGADSAGASFAAGVQNAQQPQSVAH